MSGELRIAGVGTQALSELLLEGGLLFEENEADWVETLTYFMGQVVVRNAQSEFGRHYAELYFHRMVSEGAASAETRQDLAEHQDDSAYLLSAAKRCWDSLVEKTAARCGLNSACEMDSRTFSVRFFRDDLEYCWSVSLSSSEEQSERTDLRIALRGSSEALFEVFGPMLAGLVFGKVREGQSRMVRSARRPVFLRFPAEAAGQKEETAASALIRLANAAEDRAPEILML